MLLCERFKNDGMIQERINRTKVTLKTLTYRDERQMTFETFSTRFQAAIDTYSEFVRYKYDSQADIIDEI